MFSVVIPLYNKEKSIANTIQSVLNQTFVDFEVIIVNDGSTDNSLSVVQQFNDSRIKVIDKPNGGVSSARNRGIDESFNEWIAFLDGDDLWKENHLEVLYQLISKFPKDKVFCTSFVNSNQEFPEIQNDTINIIDDYFVEAINGHFFWTSVVCIEKSILLSNGKFNTNLVLGEDIELWAKIGRKNKFIKSNLITAIYKLDAENRACLTDYNYDKSFISTITLKNKSCTEKKYLFNLLIRRLYASVLQRKFNIAIDIIKIILIR